MTRYAKDQITYGASDEGYRYAELMFVAFATAVQIATATPRFALGLGIVDEIHARISWNIEKEPMAWRNIACTYPTSVSVSIPPCIETYEVPCAQIVRSRRQNLTHHRDGGANTNVVATFLGLATVPRVE